ncbi:MAG: GNAT family N-acetyltransferase [Caldilineaceae bacterium]|nr:GNAT family N-acetyltransferase [Caldilineaceae bacterium]
MEIVTARPHDLATVRELIRFAHHRHAHIADEDLATTIARGDVLLAREGSNAVALLITYTEPPPPSLPASAPNRVYLRAFACARTASPTVAFGAMLLVLRRQPRVRPQLLIAYGDEGWISRTLASNGMSLVEQVQFFELSNLRRGTWPPPDLPEDMSLRSAGINDLDLLAAMDALSFDLLWHYSARELHGLCMRGHVEMAVANGVPIGYFALTTDGDVASLARLAVHPDWQGRGLGRALLVASLLRAQAAGCQQVVLNTQAHNERAKTLYHSLGFRFTGRQLAIFTSLLDIAAGSES